MPTLEATRLPPIIGVGFEAWLIKENRRKPKKGSDLDAGNMLMATMGHRIPARSRGHPRAGASFGGLYDAHMLLNGIVMPHVLKANRARLQDIERAAAISHRGGSMASKWIWPAQGNCIPMR
jgi:hypothetical protein